MIRKIVALAACLALFSLLMTGCGGDSAAPQDTAKTALEATVSGDFTIALEHFCAKMKEDMPSQEILDEVMKELKTYTFDFSGLTYELVEETETDAKVHVSGTIKATGPEGENKDEEMDETIGLVKEEGAWKVCE